jgi:hypothetical protein
MPLSEPGEDADGPDATGVQTGPGYTPEQQWSVTPQSGAGRSATLGAVASGAGALLVCLALF